MTNILEIRSEIARQVVSALKVQLGVEESQSLARKPTENVEAYRLYLLGLHYWWQWSEAGMSNALRSFQRAIEIEPDYAPGHAGLALAYVFSSTWVGPVPASEGAPKVKAAAQRAIQLDSTLADAHVALGYARMAFDWDWAGAKKEFERALELSPRSSLALDGYANVLVPRGRFEEALVVMNQALESDPLSPALHADLGWTYWVAGQFDQAIPHYRTVLELDPNFHVAREQLGWCYLFTGKTAEALAQFQTVAQAEPDRPWTRASLAYAYGVTGQRDRAMEVLKDLEQLSQKEAAQKRPVWLVPQAIAHLGLGQTNKALQLIEQACQERESWIIVNVAEPPLAPLRNEPRFQAVRKKLGYVK
jgi:Tfp pilus assembly protein PilF